MAKNLKTGILITGDSKGAVRALEITGDEVDDLAKRTKKASKTTKDSSTSIVAGFSDMATKAAKWGAAATAAGAAATAAMVKSGLESVDALAKTSDKLGVTTESLARLRFAAEQTGVETNKFDVALQRFTRRLADAAAGSGPAVAAFDAMGLSAAELVELEPDQAFAKVADKMNLVENQSQKVSLAFKLFDSEGVGLVNTLALGSDGLSRMAEESEILGLTLSRVDAAKVEAANDSMNRIRTAVSGFSQQLAIKFAPLLQAVADKLFGVAKEAGGMGEVAARTFNAMIKGAGFVANGIRGIEVGWNFMKLGFQEAYKFILEGYDKLGRGAIELYNMLPWVDEVKYTLDLQGFILTLESEIEQSRERIDELMSRPLPSDVFVEFSEHVERSYNAAAEASVLGQKKLQGELITTGDVTESLATKSKKAGDDMASTWQRNRDVLSNFFFEFAQDGANAFDTLVDSFKAMLTKMVAEAAANDILSFFTGSDYGGSSLFSFFGSSSPQSGGRGGGFNFGNAVSLVGTGQAAYTGYQAGGFTGAFNSVFGTSFGGAGTTGSTVGIGSTSTINAGAGITSTGGQVGGQFGANAGGSVATGGAGSAWAAAGYAAIIAGVVKGLSEINAGQYGVGDIVTGRSFDIKYKDELNDIIGGLGDVVDVIHDATILAPLAQALGLGDVFGGKSNQAGRVSVNLAGAQTDAFGVGNSFSQKNVDALDSVSDSLFAFTELIGGSDAIFDIWRGRADGFRVFDEEGDKLIETKNNRDFFNFITDYILEGATNLDAAVRDKLIAFDGKLEDIFEFTAQTLQVEALRTSINDMSAGLGDLIVGFQGTEEQVAEFASSMVSIAANAEINSVTRAIEDFGRATPTMLQSYRDQTSLVRTLVDNFDGSAAAATELSQAFIENKSLAYEFATAIKAAGEQLATIAADQAAYIRESVLSAEELRTARTEERDALRAALETLTDPSEVEEATRRILELNRQIFDSLSEEQRQAEFESFAAIAEGTNDVAQQILATTVDTLQSTQEQLNSRVSQMLTDSAARQQQAAETLQAATDDFGAWVQQLTSGVNSAQTFDEITG